ncbi:sulfurtransferase [Gemmata sp.]|uniref:sulfurtransferase n=1 Tax=Gemmata sp. TaxID=1914242 RepID=UPI003F6E9E23
MTRFAALATAALLASAGGSRAGDYPRPDLLVEPAALAQPDALKGFVILDARPRAKYEAGHVPGARWVDHADWAKGFGDGRDAAAWSKRIGGLGLTADSRVVVYDDNQAKDAARVWWVLRYWGVKDARLLNGGWVGWEKGKHPTEKAEAAVTSTEFKAVAAAERLATKDQLLKSLTGDKLQIVDARSEGEFCGIDGMKNARAGAIPGATQLEWIDLIDKDSHRFKSPDELKKLFDGAGIKLDRPTATHCQSGGRASVMAYGLELMGAKDVRNYYKSWSEWGNADDTPVVKPEPKKK